MAGWRDGGALEGGYWPTPSRAGAFRNNTVKIRRTNEANFWTVNIDADGRFCGKLVLRQVGNFQSALVRPTVKQDSRSNARGLEGF